jgi:hypothetical protein
MVKSITEERMFSLRKNIHEIQLQLGMKKSLIEKPNVFSRDRKFTQGEEQGLSQEFALFANGPLSISRN